MKKIGKYLLMAGGGIVALAVVLMILVKVLITPERVRATVLPLAQEKLQREVTLGDVQVSLFSGITLRDFVIREADGGENFVSIDGLVLRYRFWPLLRRQVVVDEVRLERPQIRVVRQADGRFNFSDLLDQPAQKDAAPPAAAGEGKPIDLHVATVAIAGGSLLFLDQAVNPTEPFRFAADQLEFSAHNISLTQPFPYQLALQLNGAPLTMTGELDLAKRWGAATIALQGLDLTAFAPYYREKLPGRLGGLKLDLDLTASGDAAVVTSQGTAALSDIDLTLDALKDVPLHNAALALNYDLQADLKSQRLTLNSSRLVFNSLPLVTAAGSVSAYATDPVLDLAVGVPTLDLRQLLAALPPQLSEKARPFDPSGVFKAQLQLAGPTSAPLKLLQKGEISFAEVAASVAGLRPALSGQLLLTGDALRSNDLTLQLGDHSARLALEVAHLLAKPLDVNASISAGTLALDPLLGVGNEKTTAKPVASTAPAAASEVGPFDLPIKAALSVAVKELRYKGLAIGNFALKSRLANNILMVDNLAGQVAQGSFVSVDRIDLGRKGLAYDLAFKISGVESNALLTAFVPKASGAVQGAIDLNLTLRGSGTVPQTLKRNLNGSGEFVVRNGQLSAGQVAQELARYLSLEELRNLSFNEFGGTVRISDGNVLIDSALAGSKVKMQPQGSFGLDGALDLRLDTRLSPDLTRKLAGRGDLGTVLSDSDGWGRVPLKVKGSFAKPTFALDRSVVREQVKEKVQQKLQRTLEKLDRPADGSGGTYKDVFKGLLGR